MNEAQLDYILMAMGIKPSPFVQMDPDKESFIDDFGHYVVNVHTQETCRGKCTIHDHSEHTLGDRPLLWRNDRKIFEHICDHGVGHPCPDSLPFSDSGIHGCCGCCRRNNEGEIT